jgi:hypothetical protein
LCQWAQAQGSCLRTTLFSTSIQVPSSSSALLVRNSTCETGSNRSQRFTPKAHGTDVKQVLNIFYFARGMALKTHAGICFTHAFTIVDNLDRSFTGISNV